MRIPLQGEMLVAANLAGIGKQITLFELRVIDANVQYKKCNTI